MQYRRGSRLLFVFVPILLALLAACDTGPAVPTTAQTAAATSAATTASVSTSSATSVSTSAATSAATTSATGTPSTTGGLLAGVAFCQTSASPTPAVTSAATTAATVAPSGATTVATAVVTRAPTTVATTVPTTAPTRAATTAPTTAVTPSVVGTRAPITTPAALNINMGVYLLGASAQITATPSVAATSAATSIATIATTPVATATPISITTSADLHTVLGQLLSEHVYLLSGSTGALLGNRSDEFRVAATTLDQNSVQLSQVVGAAYGMSAQSQFLTIWRAHTCFFLQYAQGTANNDAGVKLDARTRLDNYRTQFDAFITGANPNLPSGSVAEALKPHVNNLLAMMDAQGAKDQAKAYSLLKAASDHSQTLAKTLADAIAKQFPNRFK